MSIFIIIRWFFINKNKDNVNTYLKYHKIIIYSMIILCFINFNALLYMLPVFFY